MRSQAKPTVTNCCSERYLFFCESAIAAHASLQARHCTLQYGTLRIVASLLQAAELLTWGGNSRTCPNRATRLQLCNTIRMQGPPKNKYHYAHPVSIIIAHQTLLLEAYYWSQEVPHPTHMRYSAYALSRTHMKFFRGPGTTNYSGAEAFFRYTN